MDDETARRREINDVMRHDVRTRVGIGNGYISMLLAHHDRMTPEQRATALQGLAEAFGRLDEFARRVLTDERLDIGGAAPRCGEVAVAALLRESLAAYPAVVADVDPAAPGTAWVDPVLVREVLDNLLANAVAAAPDGTPVTLRVRPAGARVRFEVRDEGDALTEADLAVLWQRYGRTERSRRAGSAGLGLGLSIVRRLVEAHGGAYGVETGDGTTFWVELPVSPNAVRTP